MRGQILEQRPEFFGQIRDKLGLTKAAAAPAPEAPAAAPPDAPSGAAAPAEPPPPPPAPVSVVNVKAHLKKLTVASRQALNWKPSIVDLLKLLDIDRSDGARKELNTELGCPGELMGDSAKMNVLLHKTVLQKIGEKGGNIPADLFD